MQWSQPPTGPAHPVAQRRTIQRHTLASEDLRLPIQRQVVAVLADQHLGQQSLGGQAAINRTLRGWRLNHGPLAHPAAIARPADHAHPQLGGDIVQHLGAVFADPMQSSAATGAGFVVDIDDDLDTRQMPRQRTAVALGRFGGTLRLARRRRRGGCRLQPGLLLGHRLRQILDPLLQGLVVELFGPAAKPIALQPGDQQLQTLDLGQRRAQDQLQRRRVVGQICGRGEHPNRLNYRYESVLMNLA
jgi:hypothetical protein